MTSPCTDAAGGPQQLSAKQLAEPIGRLGGLGRSFVVQALLWARFWGALVAVAMMEIGKQVGVASLALFFGLWIKGSPTGRMSMSANHCSILEVHEAEVSFSENEIGRTFIGPHLAVHVILECQPGSFAPK